MATGGSTLPSVPSSPPQLSHLCLAALHKREREIFVQFDFAELRIRWNEFPILLHPPCAAPLAAAFSLATRLMRIMIMMILWRIVVVAVASCCCCCWCVVFALFAGLLAALAAIIVEILCSRPSHDHNGNVDGGSNRKT